MNIKKIQQGINKKIMQPIVIRKRKRKWGLQPITIISSDCSGGILCHDYGLPLDSPTVNLMIEGKDFIKFCSNLSYYLECDLIEEKIHPECDYPIAYCDDIRILGVHYKSFLELKETWDRRKKRVHQEMVYLMTERQLTNEKCYSEFFSLKGRKLFLSSKEFALKNDKALGLLEFDRMFMFKGLTGHRYLDVEFNFAEWLLKEYKRN